MSVEDIETGENGFNRRKALQRFGVGAAVAWTAPSILATLSASAGQAGSAPGCNADGNPCSGQTPCDPNNGGCYCNQNVGGGTHCTQATDCTNQDCSSNADCPSGQVCQNTCCATSKCFVICAGQQGAPAPASGWASAPK